MKAPLLSQNFDALRSRLKCCLVTAALLLLPDALIADLSATFNAVSDVPVTASSYTASGAVDFTLNFAPEPGTNLTVVKNTGLPFIDGAFTNLANGATVNLSFNGTSYPFVAWYYGGEGNNDLVLLWPYMRMAGWGNGSGGPLGQGTHHKQSAAVVVYQRGALAGKTIVQVVATGGSSFALTSEGKVFSWGSGANGMLGTNQDFFNVTEPEAVRTTAGSALSGRTVVRLAGGATHCLALCSDGTLVSWGNNADGQLGDNSKTNRLVPVLVNTTSGVSALSGKTVVAIAAGASHSLALCSDGTLAAWGLNASGQLGNNTTVSSPVPLRVDAAHASSALLGRTVAVIDAGTSHNLALCTDGALVAWGSNASGELGDNSTVQAQLPVLVSTDPGSALQGKAVMKIFAGGATSLALCSDGTLAAWGSNSHGQLGNGSTMSRQSPFPVSAGSGSALEGKSVVDIAAAGTSSLALCSDGTVASWGKNAEAQLGDASFLQRLLPVAVNTTQDLSVLAGRKVHQICGASVYQDHSLVLFGMVREQMIVSGNGVVIAHQDTTPSAGDHTDFEHANLNGASVTRSFMIINNGFLDITFSGSPRVAITGPHAGDFSISGLTISSPLQSPYWTTFSIRFDPTSVGARSATVSIQNSIQDTNPFTFAIQGSSADPEIVLEQPAGTELSKGGTRDFGENVPGSTTDLPFVLRNAGGPGSLLNGLNVTLTGANASEFSIIGTPPSTLVGPEGQASFVVRFKPLTGGAKTATLSIASNDTDENPYQIQLTGSAPTSLSAVFNSSSDVGMTLNGLRPTTLPLSLTLNFAPEPGTNLTVVRNTGIAHIDGNFTNLANGELVSLSHNGSTYRFVAWYYGGERNNDLVLLWPGTGLAAWGDNSSGQLGDGTTAGRLVPGTVDQSGALLGKTIVQVARGHDFALALTSEGQVFSWGSHTYGQLGSGSMTTGAFRSLPVAVTAGALNNRKVVCIAAGHSHCLALLSDGRVVAWGANAQDQLGIGYVAAYTPTAQQVSLSQANSALYGKSVATIAAGGQHSLALCSDGTLAAWGDNEKGQLGDNSATRQMHPKAVNRVSGVSALSGKTVTAISAGADHSLALCSDGTAAAWGGNGFGQLGINSTTDSWVPVQVSTADGVSALSAKVVVSLLAAGSHSRALCSDGTLAAWGHNQAGSLGDGTTTDRWLPVRMNPPDGGGVLQGRSIVAFTGNQALCSDGTLAAWGSNSTGQVGDSTTTDRPTPVAVNTDSGVSSLAGRRVTGLGGPGLPSSPSFAIYGKTLVSKISLSGNGTAIAHGDTNPSVTDHTDFVGANVTGGSTVRTFTIRNLEVLPLNLTGSPKVQISGPHASEFTVTSEPASPVASLQGSSTFQITFDPAAFGERSATVSIASDDASVPVFSFAILGRGVEPDLVVEQPARTALLDEETRDLGKVALGSGRNMVFTVKNAGAAGSQLADFAITLDGADAGDFSVVDSPDAPVAGPAGLTTFTVRFAPGTIGPKSAMLHLTSNDSDASPFDIHLTGEGFTALEMVFNEGFSAAHVASDFVATGATLNMTLNFAPTPGTNLTVIKNTGPTFIEGTFANLANGATVNLSFNGTSYPFVAWYYGGEGNNDLVLLWAKTMLAGWGSNSNRQLTDYPSSPRLTPKIVDGYGVMEGKTIVQVAQGRAHCLALTTEGRVYAWGDASDGKLGDNGQSFFGDQPVAVNTTISSLNGKTVVAVAAGAEHSLALCSDGTVSAWGSGPLGTGSWTSAQVPMDVERFSGSSALADKFVTAIAAGQHSSLALCSDGTVAAWGINSSGQLGDNTRTNRSLPVAVNTANGLSALHGKTVVAISAGGLHCLALCSDGTLTSWGDNAMGQVGDGTTMQRLVPVAVNGVEGTSALFGKTVTSLAAGELHSLALCSDGSVSAWGDNSEGQLGDDSLTNRTSPVAVCVAEGISALFGKTVTGISSGGTHSLVLCSDGAVASWGGNAYGQLGDNTQISRSAPGLVNKVSGFSVLSGQPVTRMAESSCFSESSVVIFPGGPCDIRMSGIMLNGNIIVGFEEIADGDTTPSLTDGTDFGGVSQSGSVFQISQNFSISNRGLEPLKLTGTPLVAISGPHASDFGVTSPPPLNTTVMSGRSTSFTIRFEPRAIGIRTATVTIMSNDPDEAPFDFTIQGTGMGAEIEVRTSGLNLNSGNASAFGDVGVESGLIPRTFVINNLGNVDLTGLTITKSGLHPQDFDLVTLPTAPVAPGGNTSFTVQANPSGFGARSATLLIANNDSNESPFYLYLTATGINGVSPVTDKPAVTGITFDGATLKAVVNASNSERQVFFDYGTTTSYGGRVAAVPGTVTGSTLTNVSAMISGLLPNTLYHFRVRAEGALGSANGANKTFTTLNRPPVALNDTALALPSGKITIPVLENDSDAGDVLSIASFTPPAAAVGSVAKVGSSLVFTPAASFAGGSFTYMAGDSYRAKSTAATVTVALASCTIGPDVTIPADSPPYELSVSANAPWTVVESVSWLSFAPPAPGANSVAIIPVPNASKTSRTAVVKVGGQTHNVTQSGVGVVPVLTVPSPIPPAAISASYELPIPTQNGPVTYTATGLPKGLTLSNLTGKITGYPTEAKTSTVTVKAKNVMGNSNTISFGITVLPFPPTMAGSYSAIIEGDTTLTDKLGGLMTMTVTSTGGVTGTLKLGAGSHSFTGRMNTAVDPSAPDPDHAVLKTSVKRTGKPNVELTIHMNTPGTDLIAGEVTLPGAQSASVDLAGSRHVWHATSRAADDFKGYYTVALQPTSTATDIPQGDGFLTFTVSPAGAVSWSGQLADGTIIPTQSAALWVDGRLPLFALLYGGKGSLHQHLRVMSGTRMVTGSPHWHKKPQAMRAYGAGFEPTPLLAVGGEYLPPVAGKTLLNRTAPATFVLDFLDGGINGVRNFTYLDQVFTMSAKHVLSTAGENPEQVKLTKIDAAKGTFTGSMTLKDTNPHNASLPEVSRPVTFQGVLVPSLNMGTGYFLLPSIIGSPVNVKTSPMTSGQVRIQSL